MRAEWLNRRRGPELIRPPAAAAANALRSAVLAAAGLIRRAGTRLHEGLERNVPLWRARGKLRQARCRHAVALWSCRARLRLAEEAHSRAVRKAERGLRAAESEAARAVAEASEGSHPAGPPVRLARYDRIELFDDAVRTPDWVAPLSRDVRAVVLPRERAPFGDGRGGRRRSRLIVEAGGRAVALDCAPDDPKVAEFVRFVNIAALNASDFTARRSAAAADGQRRIDEARTAWDSRLDEARRTLRSAQDDRAAVERRQQRLDEISLDTAEIEACADALAALERDRRQPS